MVQIVDDETGDLVALTDINNDPLYAIYLEISSPRGDGSGYGLYGQQTSWYDECGAPIIFASLSDYITIVGLGTIQIQIPYTQMQKMHGNKTYNVYLRLEDAPNADARQILIGTLPIPFGGRGP